MPLTMENSGALVAGAPLPNKTRMVRVVRPFMYGGTAVLAGAELTLPAIFATELVAAGKAEYLPPRPADPPAAAPPAAAGAPTSTPRAAKIGRASCRERVSSPV